MMKITLFIFIFFTVAEVFAQTRTLRSRPRPISTTVQPGERLDRSAPLPTPRRRPGSRRPYYPPSQGWLNGLSCGAGAAEWCLDITQETLAREDECATNIDILGPATSVQALLMNRYADTLFFQELAARSVNATNCQIQILDPAQRAPLTSAAYQTFETLRPLIQTLARARNRSTENFQRGMAEEIRGSQGGSGYGIAYSGSVQTQNDNTARINQAIDQILTQLPFGSHPEARANMQALAERGASEAEFAAAYNANLNTLKGKFEDAKRTFEGIQNRETGYYDLEHSQYVELYASPGARQLASQIDPSGRSLKCRFDACFIDGPRNARFAAILGLVGVTVLTLGEASPLLVAATTAAGVTMSAAQIAASCGQRTLNATAEVQNQCSASQIAQTSLSEMSRTQCAVDIALGSLDVILPGAAALRGTTRAALAAREARALALATDAREAAVAGQFLREGENGARIYRNAENVETTVFPGGRREYLYPNGTRVIEENGVRTTRYTNGLRDVEENGVRTTYEGTTVVERQLADGTIERPGTQLSVSGGANPRGNSLIAAGRLERGENASSFIERAGYRRVSDPTDSVQVFRNARGQEIQIPSGARLTTAEADRVQRILERGEGSYTAPGVRRSSSGGLTVADSTPVPRTGGVAVSSEVPVVNPQSAQRTVASSGSLPLATDATRGAELELQRDRIFREFAGGEPSFRDQEIILDILSGGPRKSTYLDVSANAVDDAFRARYLELEQRITSSPNRARYMDDFRELTDLRVRAGNSAAEDEIANIRRTERNTEIEEIDCSAMASVYPGSFPTEGGRCKRVKFNEESRGNFCSCGARTSTSVNWLIRCPQTAAEFRSIVSYVDGLALPHASAPEMCARVDIPAGRECYVGPTSATFAGFGGVSQMLCFNGRSSRAPAVAARERFNLDMPADAASHVRPVRWSPFATFPEYADLIQRMSRACPVICEDIRAVRADFNAVSGQLRSRLTNPADIARFEQEQDLFRLYVQDLQYGRMPLPSQSEQMVLDPGLLPPGQSFP